MLCSKCNTNHDEVHRFCKNCGYELEIHHKDPNIDVVLINTYEEQQKKDNKNRNIAIVLFVILLVFIAIVLTANIDIDADIDDSISVTEEPKAIKFNIPELIENIDFNIIGYEDLIVETSEDEIEIKIQTIAGANVIVNEISVSIDENGTGSIVLDKLSQGINKYEAKIICDGYEDNALTIIVIVQKINIIIPLSIDSITVQDSKRGIVLIQGYTQNDISLACNIGFYKMPVIYDDGKYDAIIQLPEAVKEYVVEIIAADKEGNMCVVKTIVEREYDEDEYYDNAIDVKGSEFFENTLKYNSMVIKLTGKFRSVEKVSDELQIIDFVLSDTDDQSITVYYYGKSNLREGLDRKLYGQYMGEEDGKIVMHSYLAYKEQ